MSENDEFYFGIQDESINATLKIIPNMNDVFRNPLYDLKMTVENDVDFLLGAVFGQITGNVSNLYVLRKVPRPSPIQEVKLNQRLFSKAPEFKAKIKEVLGV